MSRLQERRVELLDAAVSAVQALTHVSGNEQLFDTFWTLLKAYSYEY